jgi:hypothetical protein
MIWVVLFLLLSDQVSAFEILPKTNSNGNFLVITNLDIPDEQIVQDVDSGLSTTVVGRLYIHRDDVVLKTITNQYKVYRDLWKEDYVFTQSQDENSTKVRLTAKSQILDKIKNMEFRLDPKHFNFIRKKGYLVSLLIAVDPTTEDKKLKIRKWLAKNRINAPGINREVSSFQQNEAPTTSSGSIARTLFDKILTSDIEGTYKSAKWTMAKYKIPLEMWELKDEK